ncbi:hypothetical protein SAMN05216588_101216 [Pseudomonas flavescens]|uniref:Protein CcmA, bactofilin family n=1 Tax=Phytopseudomonas flavescens TaxID=29435 RepID=A0A1G7XPB7_9GAMM|nr:hypothetical protein [Pseudomonas flavescens]SDG86028.1 hypothetical protein SAMN05216588_101216 [Pseudomonas flavescens]
MDSYDIIDGRKVPQLTITSDTVISDKHQGSIKVVGCQLTILGTVNGSISVYQGGSVIIQGQVNGSLAIDQMCTVTILGRCNGSASLANLARVLIEPSGRLAGSIANFGELVVRGAFGGAQSGNGRVRIEGDGYIKQPVIRNGVHYYDW